jgi:hypothetical protein
MRHIQLFYQARLTYVRGGWQAAGQGNARLTIAELTDKILVAAWETVMLVIPNLDHVGDLLD